jgi:hypothetical protein
MNARLNQCLPGSAALSAQTRGGIALQMGMIRCYLTIFLLAMPAGISLAAESAMPASAVRLEPVKLRGYGVLSGAYWAMPSLPEASVLQITCESTAKAQLVLAKYLSDLECLPGVADAALPSLPAVTAHQVAGQGAIAAVRTGSQVYILTAADLTALATVVSKALPDARSEIASKAEVPVPMYLDRWDKFGFRFYYRAWETPKKQAGQVYDVNHEFEWAKAQRQSGLVFWASMNSIDSAEGITAEPWWDWAEKAARKNGLPTGINDSGGLDINRYRDQEAQRMPQFVGGSFDIARQDIDGAGMLSWNATTAADEVLGLTQSTIRDFRGDSNVVSWLEPHGEIKSGANHVLMEWGPAADAGYRAYLKETYGSLAALNQRWYGEDQRIHSWDEVRVPEVASFLGWNPTAIDLTGLWRIGYEPFAGPKPSDQALRVMFNRRVEGTVPAPDSWYASKFDDSSWPAIEVPGNDAMMFLPHSPAVFRRTLEVSSAWRDSHPKAWLYLFDLSIVTGDKVRIWLNDVEIARSPTLANTAHWCAVDVSKYLKTGSNCIAIRLPKGYLAYRAYLSPDAPVQYPNLGIYKNAQWVDFANWQQWCRINMVKRGMEMIRQADPDRNITLMHPDEYSDGLKQLCRLYGAEFHNTGYMAAFYSDLNPLLMNGADLPCSLEPGSPPPTLEGYKNMLGLYYSEGVQGVDYFIHIGDVLWSADIRKCFEETQNKVHIFGKYHAPKAKVAVLYAYKANAANIFPWESDPNAKLNSGYWAWNVAAPLLERCDRDAISDSDFTNGAADAYGIVIDSNTSVMDDDLVGQIERYVSNGGVFVAFGQTGRHTTLRPDTWPIARLTGYKVSHIDKLSAGGTPLETRSLRAAPGQAIYDQVALADLNAARANGLSLQSQASDTHDLLLWSDGTVACGYRRIGKGIIIQLGCKWTGAKMADHIDPDGNSAASKAITTLLSRLMDWQGVPRLPGRLVPANDQVMARYHLSNNGLYDVWTLWNRSSKESQAVNLAVDGAATAAYDVDTGSPMELSALPSGGRLNHIQIQPKETKIFLVPRGQLASAPLDWLKLQRNWWRGTSEPSAQPLPPPSHRFSADLGRDWDWRALSSTEDAAQVAKLPDDTGWEKMDLGIWTYPDHTNVQHGLFRRSFTVPPEFAGGHVSLWLQSQGDSTFVNRGRVWFDGVLVRDWAREGIAGNEFGGVLKPGTKHTVAVEIDGTGALVGSRGTCWLAWKPAPAASVDLAGEWTPSRDILRDGPPVSVPGQYEAFSLRRSIVIPASFAGQTIIFSAVGHTPLSGVLVNGRWVQRKNFIGDQWSLNITPWAKPGAVNTFEMISANGPAKGAIDSVALETYAPGSYP